jgi:hypothetical protein
VPTKKTTTKQLQGASRGHPNQQESRIPRELAIPIGGRTDKKLMYIILSHRMLRIIQ